MMPKALYGAVWVIKNVYCDWAEWLAERVLLFTCYCFRLIYSAELLKSLSNRHSHLQFIRPPVSICCFSSRKFLTIAPYLLLAYNEIYSPTVSYLLWMNADHVTLNDNMHHLPLSPCEDICTTWWSFLSEYQSCNWAEREKTWRAHRGSGRPLSLHPSFILCVSSAHKHVLPRLTLRPPPSPPPPRHAQLFLYLLFVSQLSFRCTSAEMSALALAAIISLTVQGTPHNGPGLGKGEWHKWNRTIGSSRAFRNTASWVRRTVLKLQCLHSCLVVRLAMLFSRSALTILWIVRNFKRDRIKY